MKHHPNIKMEAAVRAQTDGRRTKFLPHKAKVGNKPLRGKS